MIHSYMNISLLQAVLDGKRLK